MLRCAQHDGEDRGQNDSIKMGEHVAALAVEDFQRTASGSLVAGG